MNRLRPSRPGRLAAALLTIPLLAAGCAGNRAMSQADLEMERGNIDTAIAHYQGVLLDDPGNTSARIKLQLAKVTASQQHERTGTELMEAGDLAQAVMELQLAVGLDGANQMALRKLGEAQAALAERRRAEAEQLTPTELAQREAATTRSVLPRLQPQDTGPISLDFRDVDVREIYRTLAQVAGLSVMFEPTLTDQVTTFQVSDTTFDEALRVLTASQGHFVKVLAPNTFLVVPDDVTKRRQYADQVMRTFFLSNAEAATVEQQLRAILASQQVSSNPELNTITVRDTPEAMEVIERMVATADKAVGEILLEVEILEVSREVVDNYGLALEPYGGSVSVAQDVAEDGTNLGLPWSEIDELTSADVFVTIPSLFYEFLRTTNDFRLVAQPKLRAKENETTQLLIGDRVPIVTTTFNPTQTIGSNVVPISSTTYEDTGILMSVLPRVHFNGEITLEVNIQVSAVTGTATIASVGDLPVFTTRQVQGSIRLKDGETNVIAGLLQDNDVRRRRGPIGLDNVPGVGAVLSNTNDRRDQQDIVISITPHLLRAAEITTADLDAIYVGTAMSVGGGAFAATVGRGGVGAVGAGGQTVTTPDAAGAGAAEAPPATMSLLPAEHVVSVEEEFAIDVTVDSAAEVFSAGLQLSYDPAVLTYVDNFEGGFLGRDGVETTMQVSGAGPGILRVGMTRMASQEGVAGGGSLVTLVFRAVAAGQSPIEISAASLRAPLGAPLAVQYNAAQVTVREQ